MSASPSPRRHRPRPALRTTLVGVTVLLAAACSVEPRVTDYGPDAEANFVRACVDDLQLVDGERVNLPLAPESYCQCVYETMRDTYSVPWDEVEAYEDEQADADEGDPPPLPENIQKSIDDCSRSTVRAPSEDSSEGGSEATTTTEG